MDKEIYVVYTCDSWKTWQSCFFRGVFTSFHELKNGLTKMIKGDEIILHDGYGFSEQEFWQANVDELDNMLTWYTVFVPDENEIFV